MGRLLFSCCRLKRFEMNWVGKIPPFFLFRNCIDFTQWLEIYLIFFKLTPYKVLTFAVEFEMFIVHSYLEFIDSGSCLMIYGDINSNRGKIQGIDPGGYTPTVRTDGRGLGLCRWPGFYDGRARYVRHGVWSRCSWTFDAIITDEANRVYVKK